MKYQRNLDADLLKAIRYHIGMKTGMIGRLRVSAVSNTMDKVVRYGTDKDVWEITIGSTLKEQLGLTALVDSVYDDLRLHAISLDSMNVHFVCLFEDQGLFEHQETMARYLGVSKYQAEHETVFEKYSSLFTYMDKIGDDDYHLFKQKYGDLWTQHMVCVAEGFWAFLMKLRQYSVILEAGIAGEFRFTHHGPVVPMTEEEIRAAREGAAKDLAYYQNADRMRYRR